MFTRTDYLDGKCTHQQYYHQFVDERIKAIVLCRFDRETLAHHFAKDTFFNTINIRTWDVMSLPGYVADKLKQAGDYLTLAGQVCVLKQAAREIVEND